MKHFWKTLLLPFLVLGLGCEGGNWFGCSQRENQPDFHADLGTPGETKIDNQLPKNDNVVVLDDEETIDFETDEGLATITHKDATPIEAGKIVIANPDQQYLTRVEEVIERRDGSTQVLLRQARIQDLVGDQSGHLSIESTPVYDLSDIRALERRAQRNKHLEGVTYETDEKGLVIIRNLELFDIDLNSDGVMSGGNNRILGLPVTNPYEKLTISSGVGGKYRAVVNEAQIQVVPTIRPHAEWSWSRIKEVRTRLDMRVKYRVDITYETAGEIHMEGLLDYIMPKKVIPFIAPGTPPVYLDIELGIPVGVSIKAETKGKTRVIFESEYEFFTSLSYDEERGAYTESDKKVAIRDTRIETKDSATKLHAELYLKPQVTTRLYRVVGPYAFAKLYGRGEMFWPSTVKKDDLYIGVKGGVGLEISEPIFLNSIASFEVDDLFDFEKSFDIDNEGNDPAAPYQLRSSLTPSVSVDQLGPEGFVVFKLKEENHESLLRYQVLTSTQNGLLVPSESFFMDGELYYYPMPGSNTDTFKVRILGADGSSIEKEVLIEVTPSVQELVSLDRYGLTTNSYKVASGSPGEFKNQVPSHDLGGTGVPVVSIPKIKECFESNNQILMGDVRDSWDMISECNRFLPELEVYFQYLSKILNLDFQPEFVGPDLNDKNVESKSEAQEPYWYMSSSDIYRLTAQKSVSTELLTTRIYSSSGSLEFDVYNKHFIGHFVAMKIENRCEPMYKIEPFNNEFRVGLRFITQKCAGFINPSPFSLRSFQPFNQEFFNQLKWDTSTSTSPDRNIIEISLPKAVFFEKEGPSGLEGQFILVISADPNIRNLGIESGSLREHPSQDQLIKKVRFSGELDHEEKAVQFYFPKEIFNSF